MKKFISRLFKSKKKFILIYPKGSFVRIITQDEYYVIETEAIDLTKIILL